MMAWLLVFTGLLGCAGDKADSGTDGGSAPDIAGRYNVDLLGVAGCENEPSWLEAWVPGPLDIEGTGSNLTFDFGEDVSFGGLVEGDGGFRFSGSMSVNGADLAVSAAGLAGIAPTDPGDGSQSLLDGEIAVLVSFPDDPDCTIEGPFVATELVDFE
jgi:hypothetical protein